MLIRPEHGSAPKYAHGRKEAGDSAKHLAKRELQIRKQSARRRRKKLARINWKIKRIALNAILPKWARLQRAYAKIQFGKKGIPPLAYYCRMLCIEKIIEECASTAQRRSVLSLGKRQVSDIWEIIHDMGVKDETVFRELSKQKRFLYRIFSRDLWQTLH
jgi:hypothetical protein